MIRNLYLMGMALTLSGCIPGKIHKCEQNFDSFSGRLKCLKGDDLSPTILVPEDEFKDLNQQRFKEYNQFRECTAILESMVNAKEIPDDYAWSVLARTDFSENLNGCSKESFLYRFNQIKSEQKTARQLQTEMNTIWRN